MIRLLSLLAFAVLLSQCQVKPQPISYGSDGCHFCKMTIVDNQHAAQLVTVKGKAFKYDAIECMMNHLADWDQPEVQLYLVADYARPGELADATIAHYLISDNIPSPMGENLTAFAEMEVRDEAQSQSGGEKLDWESLKKEFKVN